MGASQSNVDFADPNKFKNYIEYLPDDVILEIAENLSYEHLMNFCNTYSRINKLICTNKNFWRQKLLVDRGYLFPNPKIVSQLENPKESYLVYDDIIIMETKLTKISKPKNVTFPYFSTQGLKEYQYFKAIAFSANQSHLIFVDPKSDMWIMNINNHDLIYKYNLNRKVIAVAAANNFIAFIDEKQHIYKVYGDAETGFSKAPMRVSEYKFKAITSGVDFVAMIDICNNLWVTDSFASRLSTYLVTRHDPMKIPGLKVKWISSGHKSLIMIDINDDIWFFSPERQQAGFNVPVIYKNNISEYPVKIQNIKAKRCSCFLNIVAIIDLDDNLWTNLYSDHYIVDTDSLQPVNLQGHKALYVWVSGDIMIVIDTEYNVWIIEFHLGVIDPFIISNQVRAHDVITSYHPNGTVVFFRQAY
jgi:hypothetical protein